MKANELEKSLKEWDENIRFSRDSSQLKKKIMSKIAETDCDKDTSRTRKIKEDKQS